MDTLYEKLREYLEELWIIDTHEHLPGGVQKRVKPGDVFCEYVPQYFGRDLLSSGMKEKEFSLLLEKNRPFMEKWKIAEPWWEYCRHTGYGRALDESVRGIYGIDGIHSTTLEELNQQFLNSFQKDHFQTVLKEHCKIAVSILDTDLDCDPSYFRSAFNFDFMVYPETRDQVNLLEQEITRPISSLDDWMEACSCCLKTAAGKGAVAFKCTLAYQRPLLFERPTYSEAQKDFTEILKFRQTPDWKVSPLSPGRKFSDYMMQYVLGEIQRIGLPLQMHTGYQEGNGNLIGNANPLLLSNLFLEYPGIQFDLFHMGYPYQKETVALGKMFPNVFLDLCWANILSPKGAEEMLEECLETVPVNKICAFGGDYEFLDGVYGHLSLAKDHAAFALARCITRGFFDLDTAKWIAGRIFFDNPRELFQLQIEEDTL